LGAEGREPAAGSLVRAYRLESVLGAGRFATVSRAVPAISQRVVALKVFDPERTADLAVAERFAAIMPDVARLQHPNLLPIKHFGEVDGVLVLAMPLASGGSLAPRARPPLAPRA
jgi:serine/threonine-protein kinase